MRTLDEQNRFQFSLTGRLVRDLRLLFRLASMALAYFTTGARIRRRYHRAERRGEIYFLDPE